MSGISKTGGKAAPSTGGHQSSHGTGGSGEHHAGGSHAHSAGGGHNKSQGGHEHGHTGHQSGHAHTTGHGTGQSHAAAAPAHGAAQSHGVSGVGGASAAHKHGDRFEVKAPIPGASHGGQVGSNPFVAHAGGPESLNANSTRHPGHDSGSKNSGEASKDNSPEV